MYTYTMPTSRCSFCYALLSTTTTAATSSSTILSSSSFHRRHATRSSIGSIERLISSSRKFQRLWRKNENGLINHRTICHRCCETIRQIEQIKNNIEQLNHERDLLMNKIEHHLQKRASILQGQRKRQNVDLPFSSSSSFFQQSIQFNDDDDTEEGEEKPRPMAISNGHEHSSTMVLANPTLVGAKRRKCNLAQKINLEEKSSLLLNPLSGTQSNSSATKFSANLLFGSSPSKRHFNPSISPSTHDLSTLPFSSAYKSLNIPASAATTPPFIDPTTGALIAIVSNPHHAALLAQQHQQMLQSSSISPSSTNTIDEHESLPTKPTLNSNSSIHPKKFPCLLCGRDFSNKSNLNRHHSIVHVAIRNFECARCPKKFKLRQGLKTHMQRCHGVNTDEPTFVLQKHSTHHHHHHHQTTFAQSK